MNNIMTNISVTIDDNLARLLKMEKNKSKVVQEALSMFFSERVRKRIRKDKKDDIFKKN